jgi:hypothetical protein
MRTQLSAGTGVVISRTTKSGEGGKRFLSQSAATVNVNGDSADAARDAALTLASNLSIERGLFDFRRARPSAESVGTSQLCGSKLRVVCAAISAGLTGWLKRSATCMAPSYRLFFRNSSAASSFTVGVVKEKV